METQDLDSLIDEAVEETVVELDTSDEALDTDIKRYVELRNRKDALTDELKTVNGELDAVEARIIAVMWTARGIDKLRKDGNLISVVDEPYPKIVDLDTFITWLDEHGHGGIAKRTVNYNTLRAWVRERKEAGDDLPLQTILEDNAGKALRLRRPRG